MAYQYRHVQVFLDERCTQPVSSIKFAEIVDAGSESKPIVLYAKNMSSYELNDVTFHADDNEFHFTPSYVPSMKAGEVKKVQLVWKPNPARKTPLSTAVYAKAKLVKRAN